MVLLDTWVNGKPAVMLLDTGTSYTVIATAIVGSKTTLEPARRNPGWAGAGGEGMHLPVNFAIRSMLWPGQIVIVMNLEELEQHLGLKFDGLLGQDILREFSAVRIDYKNQLLELQQ